MLFKYRSIEITNIYIYERKNKKIKNIDNFNVQTMSIDLISIENKKKSLTLICKWHFESADWTSMGSAQP